MTQVLKSCIADFDKVCKVSSLISQICQISGLDWWEKRLLNEWAKIMLDNQKYDESVSFIFAKYDFIDYLRSDENCMSNEPVTPFLIDVIKYV